MILRIMENWGWLAIIFACGVFILGRWRDRGARKKKSIKNNGLMFVAVGTICFLFGASTAINLTGSPPIVTKGWGGPLGTCAAVFDANLIQRFAEKYDLAMACGITNASIDKVADQNITLSNTFEIHPGQITIVADYSSKMNAEVSLMQQAARNQQFYVNIWHNPLLVPKKMILAHIATLREFEDLGGIILN